MQEIMQQIRLRKEKHPQEPFCSYLYDLKLLRERVKKIKELLPAGCQIFYAVKANSHPAVLHTLAPLVDGFEVASAGEIAKVRKEVKEIPMIFGGPAKTKEELKEAIDGGIRFIHAESLLELRRLGQLAQKHGRSISILLRVNLRDKLPDSCLKMAGAPTQFGIDEEQLPQAVAVVKAFPLLEVKGFHFHSMSNNLDEEVHADFVGLCLYKADDWSERWEIPLQVVNVGGGMGIDYRAPERSFSWERFAFHLNQVIERAKKCPTLIFEPGRSLVAPCGVYASEVWDLKCNHGQHFVVLRGGSHHFRLPAAWKHNHPFVVLPIERWDEPYSRPEVRQVPVTVAGELCTPNDVLAREVMVERVRVGDILLFLYAGAYGWEISHYQFLSHPRPQMIFFGQ